MTMPKDWVDVCIQERLDAGELLSRLDDSAVQGAWEDEGVVHLYWTEDQWNDEKLASVRSVLADLAPSSLAIPLSVQRVPSQDWNEAWTRSVKPLRIGRLMIRPSWEPVLLGSQDIEIVLDPKQAFGTGHHATTRMLLEWLQEDIRGGEQVLDVGTGSAILAMAAVKLGAASAIGVEIDSVAVDCAKEYVAQNRLNEQIDIIGGTLADLPQERRQTIDLVLANLDRQTVLGLADDLAALRGASILVSGILIEQQTEIMDRLSGLGLVCLERREEEGWVALKFIRPESCDGEM
ncbi:50S ribosomal protein L11 methyltransferase [Candidatus Nitrospira nitrificans]|uniref:Ribosomal protein L11 methyltransferase n=1 Tax=Candidatus Nitrospira nitrificans TaxID=1742973 RepID=A0A0S4L3G8_9BACT|nr:50S ribosomal protein L11 methyltransferase [Candidatus Nitrospira nitrificans]CUS32069.1 Ribosomal protein L11 methyltransferase [Candidatus Nitrospira nitrificans]